LINCLEVSSLHGGDKGGITVRRDDPLFFRVRYKNVLLAPARSCCRWRAQRSSVPRPCLPTAPVSTGTDPSAVPSRPARSVLLPPRRQRHARGPNSGNAFASAKPSSTSRWRVRATVARLVSRAFTIPAVAPALAGLGDIRLKQHTSLQDRGGGMLALAHQIFQRRPFVLAQTNNILFDPDFRHIPIPGTIGVVPQSQRTASKSMTGGRSRARPFSG
jgi:hypothetical protein